jgi:hypothetical protein
MGGIQAGGLDGDEILFYFSCIPETGMLDRRAGVCYDLQNCLF